MNWRMVGTMRRGLRRGESGQAFAELAVSLIAILAVLIGFLLVAALGTSRVSTLIRAREKADVTVRNNAFDPYSSSEDARYIRDVLKGPDGIPFTTDDVKDTGSSIDSTVFTDELSDNTQKIDFYRNPPPRLPELRDNNEFSVLSPSNFFVDAASLISESDSSDPLREHKLDTVSGVQSLFGIQGLQVEEEVYMPAHKGSSAEGDD